MLPDFITLLFSSEPCSGNQDSLIPDRHIVRPPLDSCLQIVIVSDQMKEIVSDQFVLICRYIVYFLTVETNGKYSPPPSNRVRSDNWMNDREVISDIQRRSSGLVDLDTYSSGRGAENGLGVGCRQAIKKTPEWI